MSNKERKHAEALQALFGGSVTCGSCHLWLNGCKKRYNMFGREKTSFPKHICHQYEVYKDDNPAYLHMLDLNMKRIEKLRERLESYNEL